mmetsp:Transcript_40241/g.72281  ORF Transcript_40241/g.72281 Transcript_40241/m.72281 type:complete len:279 (+) Transcript_40241:3-839(+)
MLMRLVRLVRLLRLLRLVRTIQGFDALYILTTSLRGSFSVLCWSFLLIFLIQLMFAFILNQMLTPYFRKDNDLVSDDVKAWLFAYFGSTSRSILTMFELSLANWPPVARMLQEEVSEWFVIFSVLHKIIFGFSVISVVNGVFMQETFKVASQDDAIMMRQSERQKRNYVAKMSALFNLADSSGDGYLSKEEFCHTVESPKIRSWLSAQDFQVAVMEAHELFGLLCDDCDEISAEQFVYGVAALKGQARSFDVRAMMVEQKKIKKMLEALDARVSNTTS